MKYIKDYLHLYLWCECIRPSDGKRFKLTPINLEWAPGEQWMPLLRPLSDMTEEEALEYCKLQTDKVSWLDIEIFSIDPEQIHFMDGTRWEADGVYEMNDCYASFNHATPEQFHYLLSNHFDLFGLIPDGLAKKTSKQMEAK